MNNIGELLKLKGLKQKWLAEQLGLSTVMMSLYVNQKRDPKIRTLIKISEILEVDINEILGTTKENGFLESNEKKTFKNTFNGTK